MDFGDIDPETFWDEVDGEGDEPNADAEAITMERTISPGETNAELTKRLMDEAGPRAALSIINLALHASNENTRLNAAKYVADWVRDPDNGGGPEGWEAFIGDIVGQAELYANTAGGQGPKTEQGY